MFIKYKFVLFCKDTTIFIKNTNKFLENEILFVIFAKK